MNLFSRHKNTVVLATVLLAQLLGLAVQVKRQTAEGPVRLIRLVAVSMLSPFERMAIYTGRGVRGVWSNYIDLRGVRRENERLKAEAAQMRLERLREQEDARQARRIQALLQFKENWIDTTVAAQVIGTSGSESSRLLYLDKGAKDGIKSDMAVITPDGVVGKILAVYGDTSQVLMINDPTSGVGAILVTSRLQGIVKGTSNGGLQLSYIMGGESVNAGEALVTSGGDEVFPKGLPIGTVAKVGMGRNLFLDIQLKPAVDLERLEEVLVITSQKAREPDTTGLGPIRASDILAEHLPGVPVQPPAAAGAQPGSQTASATPSAAPQNLPKPAPAVVPHSTKPATTAAKKPAVAISKPATATTAPVVPAKPASTGTGSKPADTRRPKTTAAKPAPAAVSNPIQRTNSGGGTTPANEGTRPQ